MITTEGFRLNNLARYTPVDPTLVSFQPTKISEGAAQAINLASSLQKYQAQKAQMEELEALKQARIKAGLAGLEYDATKSTEGLRGIAPAVNAGIAASDSVINRAPSADAAAIASNGSIIARAPTEDEAAIAAATTSTASSKNKLKDLALESQLFDSKALDAKMAAAAQNVAAYDRYKAAIQAAKNAAAKANFEGRVITQDSNELEDRNVLSKGKTVASIDALEAAAAKDRAMADDYNDRAVRAREQMEINRTKISENLNQYKSISTEAAALDRQLAQMDKPIMNDPEKPQLLVSLHDLATREITLDEKNGRYKVKSGSRWFPTELSPAQYDDIQRYKSLVKRANEMREYSSRIALRLAKLDKESDEGDSDEPKKEPAARKEERAVAPKPEGKTVRTKTLANGTVITYTD